MPAPDPVTEPFIRTTWTDPVTGRHGYLVIDTLVRGLAGGGTRIRSGCTLEEVERLARAMSYKNGSLHIPTGGAKCGIDCDPQDPEAQAMLTRFVRAMRPTFSTHMATGEDMGTSQKMLDEVFRDVGLGLSVHAAINATGDPEAARGRVVTAGALSEDGIGLVDLVGGYGVAEACSAAIRHLGWAERSVRAVIQGFGSMGGSSARYLSRQGIRVVGIADARGTIVNPSGLDVERLLAARNQFGEVDRAALGEGDSEMAREDWIAVDAELAIPAAVADSITVDNCDRLRARLVVEAANIPTTAAAEQLLFERNVVVVPDFVANAATNGWFWWTILGEIEPTAEAAFTHISKTMRGAVASLLELSAGEGIPVREAATRLALANMREMAAEHGALEATR